MTTSKPPYLKLVPSTEEEEPEGEMLRVFGFPDSDGNGEWIGECFESMWVEVVEHYYLDGEECGIGVLKNHPVLSTLTWGAIVEWRIAPYPDEPGERGPEVPVFQGVYKSAES